MSMYFKDGVKLNAKATFGKCLFAGLRKEVFVTDEDGKQTADIKQRVYNVKSYAQGQIVQVILPDSATKKTFKDGDEIEIKEAVQGAVPSGFGRTATLNEFIKAEDIVKVAGQSVPVKDDK